jgi:hypothetical protein
MGKGSRHLARDTPGCAKFLTPARVFARAFVIGTTFAGVFFDGLTDTGCTLSMGGLLVCPVTGAERRGKLNVCGVRIAPAFEKPPPVPARGITRTLAGWLGCTRV